MKTEPEPEEDIKSSHLGYVNSQVNNAMEV